MPLEFAQRLRRIPVYPVAAGYDLGREVALLASNESAFGPVPEVFDAVANALSHANRYPDPSYQTLRRALADRYGVPPERIALGNGSCDILLAAAEALLEPGAELVYAWPAFSIYPHLAATSGARALQIPLDSEDRHDLEAMAREITVATRLVLVCNPNNPTSTARGLEEIEALLERCPPHVCVVLDEAYAEFSLALGDTYASVELLRRWPNLVVLRTFSKVYGLAGLRAGYALCGAPEFRQAVDQVRQPFYLNVAAQAAATEALRHQYAVEQRVTKHAGRAAGARAGRRGARPAHGLLGRQLHLGAPARGRRPARAGEVGRGGPCSARRTGPRGSFARRGGRDARDGRDARGEPAVHRRDARVAVAPRLASARAVC